MAYEFSDGAGTPHADGWDDLLTKLNTFLTTNATLVGLSQEWTKLEDSVVDGDREVYLRGPGLAGTDEIHVNIKRIEDLATGSRNWEMRGAVGYDVGLTFEEQAGVSGPQYFPLIDTGNTIQYWFWANGRRFMIVAKIGTVYLSCYCGFYLPYATPSELPYPLAIMCGGEDDNKPYNEGTEAVTGFFNPKTVETTSAPTDKASNSIRMQDGSWIRAVNETITVNDFDRRGKVWPNDTVSDPSYTIGNNDDGNYVLLPFILYSDKDGGDVLGELDGVFWISGRDNLAENDLTIGVDNYVVHQSSNQSNIDEFAAFKTE